MSGGYAFTVAAGELHADVFRRGVADGRALLESCDPQRASEVLRLGAIDSRIEADLALGRHGAARRRAAGARVLVLLEPHAEQFINVGGAWFGAVTHHLALLHATVGAVEAADADFAAAVRSYERLGAGAWLARCRLDRVRWARASAMLPAAA